MMKKYLENHKMDVQLLNNFSEFAHTHLEHKDLYTAFDKSQHSEQNWVEVEDLIKRSNGFFFSFVELEDVFEANQKKPTDCIQSLRHLSTSLNQAEFDEHIQEMMSGLVKAHTICREHANNMQHYQEPTYVEEFKASRPATFNSFMKSLREANKGPFINNFNMYHMSLPMEQSPRNNFWFAYALSAQLDYEEKEERFKQLVQAGSCEIGSRKMKFLGAGKDFQPSLAMNCFWSGPCSVFKQTMISTSEEDTIRVCRQEFEKQYELTKGAEHRE